MYIFLLSNFVVWFVIIHFPFRHNNSFGMFKIDNLINFSVKIRLNIYSDSSPYEASNKENKAVIIKKKCLH